MAYCNYMNRECPDEPECKYLMTCIMSGEKGLFQALIDDGVYDMHEILEIVDKKGTAEWRR